MRMRPDGIIKTMDILKLNNYSIKSQLRIILTRKLISNNLS